MIHALAVPGGYEISDERARIDMAFVHCSLAGAYWATNRSHALTERSWANCLCIGLYAPDDSQAGFGRVLTDYTFRAHLADILVGPACRGRGLGKALVGFILAHPELATVTRWTLTTANAQGLYAGFGFRTSESDPRWMTLTRT